MKKILVNLLFLVSFSLLLLPTGVKAQESNSAKNVPEDVIFKAEVVEVIKEQETVFPDGSSSIQQNLLLRGIKGEYQDEEVVFEGIGNLDVISLDTYEVGDIVFVNHSQNFEGDDFYYIVDSYRLNSLWYLVALFVAALLIIGRWKGLRSIIALSLTFLIIIKIIVAPILSGSNPLLMTILGSLLILLIIIYLTEGINVKSHLAVTAIFSSLVLTVFISWLFVKIANLSGAASEDVMFLFNLGFTTINLQGLLLAGIIIGALGVLDDVVISQISTAKEIASSNREYAYREVFKKTYSVGVSHIASMTNTLFLAYAGVSMPLLILFVSGESAFSSFEQIINTELIATEIIRALTGSIGLILSVPIATSLAAWYYGKKYKEKNSLQ